MNTTRINISKRIIRDMFSPAVYRRAQSYYHYGRVLGLEYNSYTQEWSAEVSGKSDDYEIVIRAYSDNIDYDCTCPAIANYGECKHAAAVMLEICNSLEANEGSLDVVKNEDQTVMRLIERFTERPTSDNGSHHSSLQTQISMAFIVKTQTIGHPLSHDYVMTIELKTGDKHLYVVKKIKDFLESIKRGTIYEFTKNFTYDPSQHVFHESDVEIINLLLEIIQNEQVYHNHLSTYYPSRSMTGDRALFIPPYAAEPLLKKLNDRLFQFEHEGVISKRIDVVNDHPPLLFSLDKNADRSSAYKLELSKLYSMANLSTYNKLYFEGTLYNLSSEQQALYKEFMTVSRQSGGELLVSEDQIEPFLTHVAPRLKKLGTLDIAAPVSDHIISLPLKVKVMVDGKDDHLEVNVSYHYGDHIINPYEPLARKSDETERILIRDATREQEVMTIINKSPFKPDGNSLTLDGEEFLYDFLYLVLPELQEKADIYLSNSVKSFLLPENNTPVASVELDSNGNWLEVNFNVAGIEAADIQNVLKAAIEKKRYYRLPDGTFVSLETEEFQTVDQMFNDLDIKSSELKNGTIQLPVYRGLQVDEIIKDHNQSSAKFGKSFRKLINHLKHPEDHDHELPSSLNANLRDYQTTGFQWLHSLADYRLGGILADDMGLGKTIQAITYILSRKEEGAKEPILVVAPASLIYNWKNEFTKFSPELVCRLVVGTPSERKGLFVQDVKPDVWITSYPLLRQDAVQYENIDFDTLILDEAQAIKNHTTKTFSAVQTIKASRRFALSGTPIENSLDELWSVFQTIMPGFFPNKTAFGRLSHQQIAKRVRPFILRRLKKDVLKELPDKIETIHESELTNKQKTLYLAYLEKIQQETKDTIDQDGFQKNRMKILAGLTRLRQICCHPSLFLENYDGDSGKMEQLTEIVEQSIQNGQRLLIFSQFASMLRIIQERLSNEGYQIFYLDGQTPSKERVEMADKFNNGEKQIFLISLKAGGTGLNLTGADTVVLYDLWWNPAIEEQAAGRAHRIGQKKVVQVIRLITRGTLEEKIYEMQKQKKELIEKVIQPGETMLTKLSENDIREILNI